jgi:hypothetical protein
LGTGLKKFSEGAEISGNRDNRSNTGRNSQTKFKFQTEKYINIFENKVLRRRK